MQSHEVNIKRASHLSCDLDELIREYNQHEDALIGCDDVHEQQAHKMRMQYMKQGMHLVAKELYDLTSEIDLSAFDPIEG